MVCIARIAALALLFSTSPGCIAFQGPGCTCGQTYDRDPFDPSGDPLGITAQHREADHCRCYCGGTGAEQLLPPSRTCSAYEDQDCDADLDTSARWVCP